MYFLSAALYLSGTLLLWNRGSGIYALTLDGNSPCKQVKNNMYDIYRNIHEASVRNLVRKHYNILKNKMYRKAVHRVLSTYYDLTYYYYNLNDNELDFLDNIRGLMM